MSLFGTFLETASKGLSWLNDNKAALDLLSGAAQGYGKYLDMRQNEKQFNKQYSLMKAQWEDQLRRGGAPSDYDSGDYASVSAGFKPGGLLDGTLAQAPTLNPQQKEL